MLEIGQTYTCKENSFKSKTIIDIIFSDKLQSSGWDNRVIVYNFWNQVGTKPHFMTYSDFKNQHILIEGEI